MDHYDLIPSPPPGTPSDEDELVADDNDEAEAPRKKKRKRTVPVDALRKSHSNESEKLETNQVLLETSARVDDAISELIACTRTLSDPSKKNTSNRKNAIEKIRESILPVLHIASRSLFDTGMSFAPFGGTKGIHGRAEAQRKKNIIDRSSEKSSALQMIDAFVKDSVIDIPDNITHFPSATTATFLPAATSQPDTAPQKNVVKSTQDANTETIVILRPQNGTSYTRSEALRVCKMYKKKSRERGMAIRAMRYKKFTPASTKVLSTLCQDDEAGLPIIGESWRKRGRPVRAEADEIPVAAVNAEQLGRPKAEDLIKVTMPKKPSRKAKELKAASNPQTSARNEQDVVNSSTNKTEDTLTPGPKLLLKLREEKAPATNKLPASRASHKRSVKEPDYDKLNNFPLPKPREGNMYKRSEAVAIITQYPRGSKNRPLSMYAMRHKGYVPASLRTIREMVCKADKGLPIFDSDWSSKGRPPLLSVDEVDAIADRLKRENGRIFRLEDTRELFMNAIKEKIVREGRDPDEVAVKLDRGTLINYEALLKSKLSSIFWKEE